MSVSSVLGQGVSHACFGLSYFIALGCEFGRLRWPNGWFRPIGVFAAGAGLLAHTIYLAWNQPSPAEPFAATMLVAWVLAIFSLFGTVHHARQAWAIFVLPLVIGLVLLSYLLLTGSARSDHVPSWILGDRTWGLIHGTLILFAAVGVGVASLSGVMYLVQSDRVRRKRPPFGGVQLLNLERLETMNRRAVVAAFPFLTVGLILGAVLLKSNHDVGMNWWSFKVLGTAGLWAVFLVLMYLRYSHSVSARRMAWLSLAAFLLTVVVLAAVHPFADAAGGTP